jgi:hypothetical protein
MTQRENATSRKGALRSFLTALIIAGAAVLSVSTSAHAEGEDSEGSRTRFGFLAGAGYARIQTGDESGVFGETSSTPDDFTVGASLAFDFSYRLQPGTHVELYLNGWLGTLSGELGNEEWYYSTFGGAVRWYPSGQNLYLRGGFGFGGISATLQDSQDTDGGTEFSDYGLGLLGSVGFDIRVTEGFVTGPRVDVVFLDVGEGVKALGVNVLFAFYWD